MSLISSTSGNLGDINPELRSSPLEFTVGSFAKVTPDLPATLARADELTIKIADTACFTSLERIRVQNGTLQAAVKSTVDAEVSYIDHQGNLQVIRFDRLPVKVGGGTPIALKAEIVEAIGASASSVQVNQAA